MRRALPTGLVVAGLALLVLIVVLLLPSRPSGDEYGPSGERSPSSPSASEATPAPERPGRSGPPWASGIVVNEVGEPIAGAVVADRGLERIGNHVQPARIRTTVLETSVLVRAGEDGRFAIRDPPTRLDTVVAGAEGYVVRAVLGLSDDRSANQDVHVVLPVSRTLVGRVDDTEGRPIACASVYVDTVGRVGPSRETLTDREGEFRMEGLAAEVLRILVIARGYEAGRVRGDPGGRCKLTLVRRRTIVEVVDAVSGEPIETATLRVAARPSGVRQYAEMPNPDWRAPPGHLRPRLSTGFRPDIREVEAIVLAPGYRSARIFVPMVWTGEPPHLRVALDRGEDPPVLTGRVVGAEAGVLEVRGLPKLQTGVSLLVHPYRTWYPLVFRAVVSPDGSFAVGGLPPGRYRLVAITPGRGPLVRDVDVPALDLRLETRPGATLEVEVEETGTRVAVLTEDGEWRWTAEAGEDRIARLADLPAGRVAVALARYGRPPALPAPEMRRVVLEAGRVTRLELRPPGRLDVRLRIVDEEGVGVSSVKIEFTAPGRLSPGEAHRLLTLRPETDGSGETRVSLLPGRYRALYATRERAGWGGFVVAEATREVELLLRRAGGRVRGRAVNARDGLPVVRRPIRARHDGEQVGYTVTGPDGAFGLSGLPPGTVEISISGAGMVKGVRDRSSPYANARTVVEIVAGRESVVRFAMPRKAEDLRVPIRVTVEVEATGEPLAGAFVFPATRREGVWYSVGAARTATDATGVVEVRTYEGEAYRLTVRGPPGGGYRRETVEVERKDGPLAVQVALTRE